MKISTSKLEIHSLVTPMGKPRMTRRDKWLDPPRPCVAKYRTFKDMLRHDAIQAGYSADLFDVHWIEVKAYIPMPSSWSKKKRYEMYLKPHRQKPDADNILKGVCDTLLKDDSGVWRKIVEKRWSYLPGLSITIRSIVKP